MHSFSKIHSLKSEHIQSFLFREYVWNSFYSFVYPALYLNAFKTLELPMRWTPIVTDFELRDLDVRHNLLRLLYSKVLDPPRSLFIDWLIYSNIHVCSKHILHKGTVLSI